MASLTAFLALLAQGLLVIGIPILIAYTGQAIRLRSKELQGKLSAEQQTLIKAGIQMAVRAAEQSGISGQLMGGGLAKKTYAIDAATRHFRRLGIDLDVDMLATLIESEVIAQFNNASPPPDTAEARSVLLAKAVQAAVLAAQQSGTAGLIRDAGADKKRFAVEFAFKYLAEHGMRVDSGVVASLIEAEIMRLKMNATTARDHA